MNSTAIRVFDLGKKYDAGPHPVRGDLRDKFAHYRAVEDRNARRPAIPLQQNLGLRPDFWALHHVSFEIERGSIVGILGDNGSGKTTLLRILARITHPTEGRAEILGRTGALLDGLAGFHGELTGRDNIFLLGTLLGLTRQGNAQRFDSIAAFSELEPFLDTPLKFYSTGMCVRLAFAIAAHADSDVLLVDEILAVADRSFQEKSLRKMVALANRNQTILFVSHDIALIQQLCTHAIVFSAGRLVSFGATSHAIQRYRLIQRATGLEHA